MTATESKGYRRQDVPADSIQKWQKTFNLMAAIFDVPAGLIMRVLDQERQLRLGNERLTHELAIARELLNPAERC